MTKTGLFAGLPVTIAFASAALAEPGTEAGRSLFRQQCVICHVAEAGDHGGGQGPSLIGVYGRHAAAVSPFSYTSALRAANLSWDAATLDQFLRAPATLVPGTTMPVAVPMATDRANMIAYLQTLLTTEAAPQPEVPAVTVPPASRRSADWRNDAPGRVHRIDIDALPAPFATPAASNESQLVARPAMATLAAPHGFKVDMFATGLTGPRKMLVAPNGDVLVSEMSGGRISVLHPTADGTAVASIDVYAAGLDQPFGLAFYPDA